MWGILFDKFLNLLSVIIAGIALMGAATYIVVDVVIDQVNDSRIEVTIEMDNETKQLIREIRDELRKE